MTARTLAAVLLAILAAIAPRAAAHELMPAYLEIRQTGPETYDILWKVPAQGAIRLPVEVALPPECQTTTPLDRLLIGDAWFDRWSIRCPGGLPGRTITIRGLNGTTTDALVRIHHLDGPTQFANLKQAHPSLIVEAVPTVLSTLTSFTVLGAEHIWEGPDHLLFVFGLMCIVRSRWSLVKTVTAFTIAHSITLAATTLGVLSPDGPTIEFLIALSILFLGPEIIRVARGQTSLTIRHPWLIAFAFGLLHGFGFAGALREIGLPEGEIAAALVAFNLGVEVGQLLFVAILLTAAASLRRVVRLSPRLRENPPAWPRLIPAYAVGSLGAGWAITRLLALLGAGALA